MLKTFINGAVKDIKTLSEITYKDIEDIKAAKHDELFKRNKIKEELISSFEKKKQLIDNEMLRLSKEHPDMKPSEFLDDEIKDLLTELQSSLLDLKKVNKRYARMVLAVSEFYNSLLDRLIPKEMNGYEEINKKASFIKVEA